MSRGLASPPPIFAGAAFIARRSRWGPPRDIAARPSRDTRHSPDVAAPSVAVVLHWLQHATCPLAAATTNEPTDSARRRQTPHSNCRSCRHEYGTCLRKLLSSRMLSTAWPRRAASRVPDWCSRGLSKGYKTARSLRGNRLPRYREGRGSLLLRETI